MSPRMPELVFLCLVAVTLSPAVQCTIVSPFVIFTPERLPDEITLWNADGRIVSRPEGAGYLLEVTCGQPGKARVVFEAAQGPWDWEKMGGILFDLKNPQDAPLSLSVSVDGRNAEGRRIRLRGNITLAAGEARPVPFFLYNMTAGPYWGMQGIPLYGPVMETGDMQDQARRRPVTGNRVALELNASAAGVRLLLGNPRVFTEGSGAGLLCPHPFIDAFGQFMHADWPGKVHDEAELRAAHDREAAMLAAAPELPHRDRFGGWADGPRLEATGWFRTAQVDGKWWLVTPEGTLFFSIGVNCVRPGDATFITGRDGWFAWLPEKDGPFAACLGRTSGVHSRAEAINGTGDTLNHFMANLIRAYGEDWAVRSRERALARLRAWGWNTVGNWSDGGILAESPIPFTVCGGSARPRAIAGSTGYWGKMTDVFDPAFAPQTHEALRSLAERYRDNPLVIGYFVDNEMSWAGIARGALASPPDQPARAAFLEDLRAKYATVEQLNAAWETDAADWDSLQPPRAPNDACKTDFDTFEYRFARTYFDAVAGALRAFAPHQLYLGCRFTPAYCPPAALRACAETADVVSINAYVPEIDAHKYRDLGKPLLIGEFHFGALDRGMFHAGVQATDNQGARAAAYVRYVESVARHPMFVGCHWFQYFDQPVTGRSLDGENFNIGLVSIADAPYPQLIDAARALHERVYTLRAAR